MWTLDTLIVAPLRAVRKRRRLNPYERRIVQGERLRQRAVDRALRLLKKSCPDYPSVQIQLYQLTDGLNTRDPTKTDEQRLALLVYLFNVRAETHLCLVSDTETQDAYIVLLGDWVARAWHEYAGYGLARAIKSGDDPQVEALMSRYRHWKNEGYLRLQMLTEKGKPIAADAKPETTIQSATDAKGQDEAKSKEVSESTLGNTADERAERAALRDRYFAAFQERIVVLDACWAAGQHYCELKRWLRGPAILKDGSAPDRSFRKLFASGQTPREYKKQPRPKGWE